MTRPVSEPQRVKNHARRSEYQAKAPVTSHEMRSQRTLSQLALLLSSSCAGFVYHKREGVVHKPLKRNRIAKMYARGHSISIGRSDSTRRSAPVLRASSRY